MRQLALALSLLTWSCSAAVQPHQPGPLPQQFVLMNEVAVSGFVETRSRTIGLGGGWGRWEYYQSDEWQRLFKRLLESARVAERIVPTARVVLDGRIAASKNDTPGYRWVLFATPLALAGVPVSATWTAAVEVRAYRDGKYVDAVQGTGLCTGNVVLYRTSARIQQLEQCAIENAIGNVVLALQKAAAAPVTSRVGM